MHIWEQTGKRAKAHPICSGQDRIPPRMGYGYEAPIPAHWPPAPPASRQAGRESGCSSAPRVPAACGLDIRPLSYRTWSPTARRRRSQPAVDSDASRAEEPASELPDATGQRPIDPAPVPLPGLPGSYKYQGLPTTATVVLSASAIRRLIYYY